MLKLTCKLLHDLALVVGSQMPEIGAHSKPPFNICP